MIHVQNITLSERSALAILISIVGPGPVAVVQGKIDEMRERWNSLVPRAKAHEHLDLKNPKSPPEVRDAWRSWEEFTSKVSTPGKTTLDDLNAQIVAWNKLGKGQLVESVNSSTIASAVESATLAARGSVDAISSIETKLSERVAALEAKFAAMSTEVTKPASPSAEPPQ